VKERWGFVRLLLGAVIVAGTLSGCIGCGGGKTIRMQLDNTQSAPVTVGIYLLSKETALDGRPNSDLTNKEIARSFGSAEGVVDFEVRPVYVDEPMTFLREDIDPAVGWVLVAANFANADPCARTKIPVKDDVKLTLTIVDKCLKVTEK
jgi:hypothetical protein